MFSLLQTHFLGWWFRWSYDDDLTDSVTNDNGEGVNDLVKGWMSLSDSPFYLIPMIDTY